jgi:P pilus assembly chaperone PapD
MAASGGQKLTTLTGVAPGVTQNMIWNNANAEVYSLHAWPVVPVGVSASAEITKTSFVVHGNPQERELHYSVKNTGTTTANIEVWVFWWDA